VGHGNELIIVKGKAWLSAECPKVGNSCARQAATGRFTTVASTSLTGQFRIPVRSV